jgi:Cys-rich four helix bundle protein (predicted Tat secretion target)
MHRRELIVGTGAAIVAASTSALAQGASHDHGNHHGPSPLAARAMECVTSGNACLDHCFATFAAGDTSLAECARKVDHLVAVCASLAKLASGNSAHLPALAKVVMAVCQDCETECRKHAAKHETCKACADACAACAAECKRTSV